jgi:glycosyltransferase involved in cell wall biosynthesis
MRVAMLSSISWRTPPRAYGPWELVTSLLTEALVARDVDVTLFATLDSLTAGKLDGVAPHGYSEDSSLDAKVWEALHVAHLFERADEFDLIHNQADFIPLAFSRLTETPIVTTIHGFSSPRILPAFERYNDRQHYVSISEADRAPSLTYAATIHHGIEVENFPFDAEGSDALLFFGRIHPDKGTVEAIDVAERLGLPLLLAGIVQDRRYFEELVEPRIDGERVRFIGAVGPAERAKVLGGARALLHLIGFEEPFGFSVVESMACGTPVIAFRRGSMPELIEDGVTGFLVDDVQAAVAAVGEIVKLDRTEIRAQAVARFGRARMVDAYLDAYERLIA